VFRGQSSIRLTSKLRNRGASVAAILAIIPLALVLAAILGFIFCEARKAYWDRTIADLCRTEGGVTVYERVQLSEQEYTRLGGSHGAIPLPPDSANSKQYPYFSKLSEVTLNEGRLTVVRWEAVVLRRADQKPLGRVVGFYRRGGDFPMLIAEPSSFSCDRVPEVRLDVSRQIFVIKGADK